jgi:hypothetical protein
MCQREMRRGDNHNQIEDVSEHGKYRRTNYTDERETRERRRVPVQKKKKETKIKNQSGS